MRSGKLVWGLLVALALSAGGCMKMPWQRWTGWKAVRSKHVTLYSDTRFAYGHTLENFEYAYAALAASPIFRNQAIAPVEVLFLEEPEFISALSRYRSGITAAALPGEGRLAAGGLIVVHDDTGMVTAAHRLTHLFLHAKMPKAPLWLHEAFASYLEGVRYATDDKGAATACYGYLGGGDQMLPLDELFTLPWDKYDGSGKAHWYRNSARTLLDYLYMGEEGRLRPTLTVLIGRIGIGKPAAEAVAGAMPGVSIEELNRRMLDFRKESQMRPRPLCPMRVPVPPDNVADTSPPRVEPLSEEDIKQLLMRIWLLPHRTGHVDWYPPESLTLATAAQAATPTPEASP
jgi:hypothetical protein